MKINFKTIVLFLFVLQIKILSYSQSISPNSINCISTKFSQINGSLSYTVGELLILSNANSDGFLFNSGFTACASLTTIGIKEADITLLDVLIYPNPTNELINIQIKNSTLDQVVILVTNFQGKEVYKGKFNTFFNIISINVSDYSAGTYFILLKNTNNQTLGSYKVVKL